jgi:hypothetical protein
MARRSVAPLKTPPGRKMWSSPAAYRPVVDRNSREGKRDCVKFARTMFSKPY